MVAALQDMLPNDADKRAIIERAFAAHPETADFVRRTVEHIEAVWPDADVELQSNQYDDWDPPVSVTITLPQRGDDLVERSRSISRWARLQQGFNPDVAMLVVHTK
jgi:hypothetical protein